MPKFDYNDIVKVRPTVKAWFEIPGVGRHGGPRPGERAWVFSIREHKKTASAEQFPSGVLYGIEFEDGQAVEVHEDDLERAAAASPP